MTAHMSNMAYRKHIVLQDWGLSSMVNCMVGQNVRAALVGVYGDAERAVIESLRLNTIKDVLDSTARIHRKA